MSHSPSSQSELEVLFQATRQIESIINRERTEAVRTKGELSELQTKHESEINKARNQVKHYAAYYSQLRVRYQEAVTRIHQLNNRIQDFEQSLRDQTSIAQEQLKRTQVELDVSKSSTQHLQQAHRVLEMQLEQLRPELARTKGELERAQSDALERDHNYQTAVLNHRAREKTLLETITSLKEKFHDAQAEIELQRQKSFEAERIRRDSESKDRRSEELKERLRAGMEAHRELSGRVSAEKDRREKAEANAAIADGEKRALIASLKATEARLREAEERIASLSASATLSAPTPYGDFQIEESAIMGYPVVRGPSRDL